MQPIKIGFVLVSNSRNPIPSTRIVAINMFPFLREQGFDPQVVFDPTEGSETPQVEDLLPRIVAEKFRIIVFQKVYGPSAEGLARRLRAVGIYTVFALCDVTEPDMVRATDMTLVVTDYLKSLYPRELQTKMRVVHDGIEQADRYKTTWSSHRGSRAQPLHAVIVTSSHLTALPSNFSLPSWLQITIVGRYFPTGLQRLREARWNLSTLQGASQRLNYLRFLASRRVKCVTWDPVDVYAQMQAADIGIIPIDATPPHRPGEAPPRWKVKSENRLTMKMAVGLPVIASPIPSYEPVIEQGGNGFLARTEAEWTEYFDVLRDPDLRRSMGAEARRTALERYSMEAQAVRLVSALRELCDGSQSATHEAHQVRP